MSSLNDCRHKALVDMFGAGHINGLTLKWLQDNGATSNSLPDAWMEMLAANGATPPFHRNDAWYALLGTMGYTGSLNDRELDFWCNFISETVLVDIDFSTVQAVVLLSSLPEFTFGTDSSGTNSAIVKDGFITLASGAQVEGRSYLVVAPEHTGSKSFTVWVGYEWPTSDLAPYPVGFGRNKTWSVRVRYISGRMELFDNADGVLDTYPNAPKDAKIELRLDGNLASVYLNNVLVMQSVCQVDSRDPAIVPMMFFGSGVDVDIISRVKYAVSDYQPWDYLLTDGGIPITSDDGSRNIVVDVLPSSTVVLMTVGTDNSRWGASVQHSFGTMTPDNLNGQLIYNLASSNGSAAFICAMGVTGNEKIDGLDEIVVQWGTFGEVEFAWDILATEYRSKDPSTPLLDYLKAEVGNDIAIRIVSN